MCSAIGLGIGLWFISRIGTALVPIMIVGGVCVLAYTDLLARMGIGEIAAGFGLGAGPVIGTALVQDGSWSRAAIAASIPAFFMTFNLLLLNEFPDEQADRKGGRKNLVILLGRRPAALVYAAAAIATPLSIAIAVVIGWLPALALVGTLPSLLLFKPLRWAVGDTDQPVPIPAIGANVAWNLATNTFIAVGLVVAVMMRYPSHPAARWEGCRHATSRTRREPGTQPAFCRGFAEGGLPRGAGFDIVPDRPTGFAASPRTMSIPGSLGERDAVCSLGQKQAAGAPSAGSQPFNPRSAGERVRSSSQSEDGSDRSRARVGVAVRGSHYNHPWSATPMVRRWAAGGGPEGRGSESGAGRQGQRQRTARSGSVAAGAGAANRAHARRLSTRADDGYPASSASTCSTILASSLSAARAISGLSPSPSSSGGAMVIPQTCHAGNGSAISSFLSAAMTVPMSVWWSDAAKARRAELEHLDLAGVVAGDGVDKEELLGRDREGRRRKRGPRAGSPRGPLRVSFQRRRRRSAMSTPTPSSPARVLPMPTTAILDCLGHFS